MKKILSCELFILKIMMPREKFPEPPNTNEKKSWNHKIPTRKNIGPTKSWTFSTQYGNMALGGKITTLVLIQSNCYFLNFQISQN